MSKPLDPEHPSKFSPSLVAGLSVLRCCTPDHPVHGIADMAKELDLGRSTTPRYATTLTTLGHLAQELSRKYRLSSCVADVSLVALDSMALRSAAKEPLGEFRVRTERTVSAAAVVDGEGLPAAAVELAVPAEAHQQGAAGGPWPRSATTALRIVSAPDRM